MATIECLIKIKKPIHERFTEEDKKALLEENKNIEYSYLSLLKEFLSYEHHTLKDMFGGWGGIQLITVKK